VVRERKTGIATYILKRIALEVNQKKTTRRKTAYVAHHIHLIVRTHRPECSKYLIG
jgi:hypothetical protein